MINTGDLDRADALVAPDFVEHNPTPGQGPGLEGFRQVVAMLRAAFPDLHITIDDLVGEGDKVSVRLTARGTHEGPFMGMAPTGRRAAWEGISIIRIADGRVAERWFHADVAGLARQLGAGPGGGGPPGGGPPAGSGASPGGGPPPEGAPPSG